jgi:hypothetical protein
MEKNLVSIATKSVVEAAAVERANKETAPGELKHVFTDEGRIKISESLHVRRVNEWDYVLLRDINSFLYKQQLGDEIETPSTEALFEFCFLLTEDQKETRRLLRKSREAFADAAVEKFFNNKANLALLPEVIRACNTQFEISLKTMQEHGVKSEAKSDVSFFRVSVESPKTE